MPFTTEHFKNACHERATCVAILTARGVGPDGGDAVRATVITEHTAAFPRSDVDECYVSAIIGFGGGAHIALQQAGYFGLSFLGRHQYEIAEDIYKLRRRPFEKIRWAHSHRIPYLEGSNAAILSSVCSEVILGSNVLIVGHVLSVIPPQASSKPLVNYQRTYRSVDDNAIPVTHPRRRRNPRL